MNTSPAHNTPAAAAAITQNSAPLMPLHVQRHRCTP